MATSMNVDDPEIQVTTGGKLKYFKNRILGSGGFGTVYEGLLHNEKVAVKRIVREAYIEIEEKLITISHCNILRYLLIEKGTDFVFIAMELCAGTLEDLIRKNYKGPKTGPMEELLLQTALGLKFLHEKNIIHRDIKPINILISMASSEDGKKPVMKLADFGLCKQRKDGATSFTNSKYGTSGWSAPEIMMTDDVKRIRFSADIFSLGCVFGYALTGGFHPFGDNTYVRASNVMTACINWPDVHLLKDEEIEKTIRRMISHDPNERPPLSVVLKPLLTTHLAHLCAQCSKHQPLNNELLEALKTCVDEQCDLNLTDEYGRNCVMLMLYHEINENEDEDKLGKLFKECFEIILSDAAIPLVDINHKDKIGKNVLHYLCEYYRGDDFTQFAKLLINRGINVNEASKDGTPLHVLVSNYRRNDICEVMQFLFDAGADVNAKGLLDRDVLLDLCYLNSSHPMLKEAVAVLINRGVDIHQVDPWGRNALTIICCKNQFANTHEVVKLLLENGIDVNAKAASGYDALLALCEYYKGDDLVNIIQSLVKNGADINSKTDMGRNALHLICQNYQNPRLRDVIEDLIEKGIDVNANDRNGHDAVYYLRNRYPEIDPLELQRLEEAIYGKK